MRKILALIMIALLIATPGCEWFRSITGQAKNNEVAEGDNNTNQGNSDSNGGSSLTRKIYTGHLDSNGTAIVSIPEIDLDDMPVIMGYTYTQHYGAWGTHLGWVSNGMFTFGELSDRANQPYKIVVIK